MSDNTKKMALTQASCSALNCGNKFGIDGVTFHRFPIDNTNVIEKWLAVIDKSKWEPSQPHFLCSYHFVDDDFIEKDGYRFLKSDAIPSKIYFVPRARAMFPKEWPYRFSSKKDVEIQNFKGYVIEARVALENEDQLTTWLKAHEELSHVSYVLTEKYPNLKKHLSFKAKFSCRFHSTKCPAKLLVKIRTIEPDMPGFKDRNTNPSSFPCSIIFCHLHNHSVESNMLVNAEDLIGEDVEEDVMEKFIEMYKGMYSQELALKTHLTDLQEQYAEDYEEIVKNSQFCPDADWVKKFYEDCIEEMGDITQEKMISSLADEVKQFNEEKGKAKFHKIEEHTIVALCTPLMERAHSLASSGEIVFLDSSGFLEQCKCYIYVVMTYSCTDGLPLGVLLTTSDSESILVSGFQLLVDLLPTKCFGQYGIRGPEAFLIDNNEGLKNSIKAVFPESTVLLCSFTLLKSIWHWLWNSDNKVDVEDRCYLFSLLHELMKSKTAKDFGIAHNSILENERAKKYPEYLAHCKEISDLSERWAVCFKSQFISKDTDVSAVEIASHVLQDKMYLTKAYNMVQLLQYLANDLECYYKQKIIHCVNNTLEKFIDFSYHPEIKTINGLEVEMLPSGQFKVTHKKSEKSYFVDMNLWICSCRLGINGFRCKHQYAVYRSNKLNLSSSVPADDTIKKELRWVATNSSSTNMESSGSLDDSIMEVEDDEYSPRHESPKKTAKPKTTKKAAAPKEEAKIMLDRIVKDIMLRYDQNPTGYHKSIVQFAVNYQSLFSDEAIVNAISHLGKSQ